MMEYYQDLITDKSWKLLMDLKGKVEFILIGGWAVYLYTKSLKSKDIDIVIDYDNLGKLQSLFLVARNHHLKKYEVKEKDVDIDIYVPFYSVLPIPVEKIPELSTKVDNFTVIKKEALLILKQKAYEGRHASIKGQKDKIDIISLVSLPDFDFEFYQKLLRLYGLERFTKQIIIILTETKAVPELSLNQHQFAKIKKDILEKLI